MYQATGDRAYLRRFVALADGILAVRDDALGRKDYAGRSLPLWGVAGKHTVATVALRDEEGRGLLAIRSIRYAHNHQTLVTVERGTEPGTWRLSHRNEFWEKHRRGKQTFDNLSLDPASPRYVETVVNHPDYVADPTFSRELEQRDNGAYVWQYWWGPGENGWAKADGLSDNTPAYPGGKYDEDLSHAAWEVEFAVQAYRRGIVFDAKDMKRFAATFTKNLWVPESNELTDRVNGDRGHKGTHNIAGGRWLELSELEPRIFDCMRRIFAVHRYDKGAYGSLAGVYARLYRWQVQLAE